VRRVRRVRHTWPSEAAAMGSASNESKHCSMGLPSSAATMALARSPRWCVVRGAWCVVRGAWCVVRSA
jgi:hypothetical protein